jgi:hypothetical protein
MPQVLSGRVAGVLDAHPSRRQWLQIGGLGLVGLSLPSLLRGEERRSGPPAAKSCVLFLLHGGPSQLDIWDMKPLAPAEVRGEFKPIATRVPGLHITEHLPRLATLTDRFTLVRSMTHTAVNHNTATYWVTTGQPPLQDVLAFTPSENDSPHLGAQIALKKAGANNSPAAVSLPDPVTDGPYTTPGQNGGFLGAAFAPFVVHGDPNDDHFAVDGLADESTERLTGSVDESTGRFIGSRSPTDDLSRRISDKRSLLEKLDKQLGRLSDNPRLDKMNRYQQRAFQLLTSSATRRAFDIHAESARLRERYGRHKYGQSLLLARRLVEAGVRLVTVYWGGRVNNPVPHWDTHFNNNRRLKEELLPPFDQCFSAFLEDLDARGLLASTLVVCMGEFGRTPRFGQFTGNGVDATGRDHWPHCYSIVVAGGTARGGRVLGRSDSFAAYPAADPYTPQDLTASILHALGINPQEKVLDGFGRSVALCTGQVRESLFIG